MKNITTNKGDFCNKGATELGEVVLCIAFLQKTIYFQ